MAEWTLVDKHPVRHLAPQDKQARYDEVYAHLRAALDGERDLLAAMATLVCLHHHAFPYVSWTGIYRRVGPALLRIGPYQGTMGCLEIPFHRGVCGAAARARRTLIVPDVDAFPDHIACDAASRSEIVVPIFDASGELLGVLDVDSTLPAAFDEVDARNLERAVALLGRCQPLPVVATE